MNTNKNRAVDAPAFSLYKPAWSINVPGKSEWRLWNPYSADCYEPMRLPSHLNKTKLAMENRFGVHR